MNAPAEKGRPRLRWVIGGWAVVAVAGPAVAVGVVYLLAAMWSACDVGVNATANSGGLLFFDLPFLLIVLGFAMLPSYALVSRRNVAGALAVACGLGIAVAWVYVAWRHNPGGDYPAPICPPDNVPGWWPGWIPI
ncbi:hypothetical protein ACWDPV_01325 [Gordonia sp. NPDC003504]